MDKALIGASDIGFPLWAMHANGNQEEMTAAKCIYKMLRGPDEEVELNRILDFLNKISEHRSVRENLLTYVALRKIDQLVA